MINRAMYYYRQLGTLLNLYELLTLANLVMDAKDYDSSRLLLADLRRRYGASAPKVTIKAHTACLLAAVKDNKQEFVTELIPLVKEINALKPWRVAQYISEAPSQDMATHVMNLSRDHLKVSSSYPPLP